MRLVNFRYHGLLKQIVVIIIKSYRKFKKTGFLQTKDKGLVLVLIGNNSSYKAIKHFIQKYSTLVCH